MHLAHPKKVGEHTKSDRQHEYSNPEDTVKGKDHYGKEGYDRHCHSLIIKSAKRLVNGVADMNRGKICHKRRGGQHTKK